jgi:hypothetical protein
MEAPFSGLTLVNLNLATGQLKGATSHESGAAPTVYRADAPKGCSALTVSRGRALCV